MKMFTIIEISAGSSNGNVPIVATIQMKLLLKIVNDNNNKMNFLVFKYRNSWTVCELPTGIVRQL
jgi:hypothetical protein